MPPSDRCAHLLVPRAACASPPRAGVMNGFTLHEIAGSSLANPSDAPCSPLFSSPGEPWTHSLSLMLGYFEDRDRDRRSWDFGGAETSWWGPPPGPSRCGFSPCKPTRKQLHIRVFHSKIQFNRFIRDPSCGSLAPLGNLIWGRLALGWGRGWRDGRDGGAGEGSTLGNIFLP